MKPVETIFKSISTSFLPCPGFFKTSRYFHFYHPLHTFPPHNSPQFGVHIWPRQGGHWPTSPTRETRRRGRTAAVCRRERRREGADGTPQAAAERDGAGTWRPSQPASRRLTADTITPSARWRDDRRGETAAISRRWCRAAHHGSGACDRGRLSILQPPPPSPPPRQAASPDCAELSRANPSRAAIHDIRPQSLDGWHRPAAPLLPRRRSPARRGV